MRPSIQYVTHGGGGGAGVGINVTKRYLGGGGGGGGGREVSSRSYDFVRLVVS